MQKLKSIMIWLPLVVFLNYSLVQAQDTTKVNQNRQHSPRFVDENGDGYNDLAPDHDGDGIPNGLDPDYQKMQKQKRKQKNKFIDLDGDGIDDRMMQTDDKKQGGMEQSDQKKNDSKGLDDQEKMKRQRQQRKGSEHH